MFIVLVAASRAYCLQLSQTNGSPVLKHDTRTRYLTYSSQDGFGNRLQSFQIALVLAKESNRTLLVPPFSMKHHGGLSIKYSHYFLPIDPKVASVVELTPSQITKMTKHLSHRRVKVSPYQCSRKLSDLVNWCKDIDRDLLHYDYGWGYWEAMFDDYDVFMSMLNDVPRMRPEILNAARTLKSYLPLPYNGMHFRLGDRQGLALVNCSKTGVEWNPRGFGCKTAQLIDDVAPRTFPNQINLYVATNLPNDVRMTRLRSLMTEVDHVRLWTFDDFPEDARRKILAEDWDSFAKVLAEDWDSFAKILDEDWNSNSRVSRDFEDLETVLDSLHNERSGTIISLIEQILVIDADHYLPSFPSSWDAYVIDKRVREGRRNAREQFDLMRAEVARVHCTMTDPVID